MFHRAAFEDPQARKPVQRVRAQTVEREAQAHFQRFVAFLRFAFFHLRQNALVLFHQLPGAVVAQLRQGKLQGERVSFQEGQQLLQRDARRARQAVRLQYRSGQFQRVAGGESAQFFMDTVCAWGKGGVGNVGVAGGDEQAERP